MPDLKVQVERRLAEMASKAYDVRGFVDSQEVREIVRSYEVESGREVSGMRIEKVDHEDLMVSVTLELR